MAGYVFENMSQQDAAAFSANDTLTFNTAGSTANQVRVDPYSNTSSGSGNGGITLTYGQNADGSAHSLTFSNAIATASTTTTTTSTTTNGGTPVTTTSTHILFSDSSHLEIGQNGTGDTLNPIDNTNSHTVYGLGGNDTIAFAGVGAGVSEYLNGGFGADTINGGNANNHIYGNSEFTQRGATDPGSSNVADGDDTITVLGGTNYINGNAGADTITAGTNATTGAQAAPASNGFNHIFGGADDDVINIAGAGHNAVNGNTGNDTITDTGTGDNTLRGGSGNDTITGGSGHSVLMGDVGNDYIIVHGNAGENVSGGSSNTATTAHIDVISGGDGGDTFDFSAAGAGQAVKFGQVTYYQEVTDFTHGVDKMILPASGANPDGNTGAVVGTSNTIFASVHDAEAYANTVLNGDGVAGATPTVEALSVGSSSNTYLMYLDTASTQPTGTNEVAGLSIVHLDNVTASSLTATDFISGGM